MRTMVVPLAGRASDGAPTGIRDVPPDRTRPSLARPADGTTVLRVLAVLLMLLAPALAPAAPVPKELRKKPGLRGMWEVVTMQSQGQDFDMYRGARWRITSERIEIEYPEGIRVANPSVVNTVSAIDERASPAVLDYTNYQGTDRKAAFAVDGDTLTLCIPILGPDRPKELKADTSNLFYTFKRVKE